MALRLDFGIWKKGPRFCGALFSIGRDGGGIITLRLRRSAQIAMGMGARAPLLAFMLGLGRLLGPWRRLGRRHWGTASS